MATPLQSAPVSLLDLLSNVLILRHTSPYIGLNGLVSLATTSKSFHDLLFSTPQVFQRLDLSQNNVCVTWDRKKTRYHWLMWQTVYCKHGSQHLETSEEGCHEEYWAQPLVTLFGHLSRLDLAKDIRTLILDGLPVPTSFLSSVVFRQNNIRLLSIREIDRGNEFNQRSLVQLLRYLIWPSRVDNEPKLKGLYYFTPRDSTSARMRTKATAPSALQVSEGVTNSVGAQLGTMQFGPTTIQDNPIYAHPWYSNLGELGYGVPGEVHCLKIGAQDQEWADLLEACAGLIAFDLTICRHNRETYEEPRPKIANIRLSGCQSCGSCPEGPAYAGGNSPESHLPLVSPLPMHASTVEAAQCLDTNVLPQPAFIARCRLCLKDRWCEKCNTWWCEDCFTIPKKRPVPVVPARRSSEAVVVLPPTQGIKVHNNLCVSNCLMDELLNGGGEGGMWG